jgi:hypothetical protein
MSKTQEIRIQFETDELAGLPRVADPRSGNFGCRIYENATGHFSAEIFSGT